MSQAGKENFLESSFDLISPFEKDPFVGHLATPITNSTFTKAYLFSLPAYQKNISPLLRGINIGFVHAYFLFGPFLVLGPLRGKAVSPFMAFLSSSSLMLILTLALFIYGLVSFPKLSQKEENNTNLFTRKAWQNFSSGFVIGALGGLSFAYFLLKIFHFC